MGLEKKSKFSKILKNKQKHLKNILVSAKGEHLHWIFLCLGPRQPIRKTWDIWELSILLPKYHLHVKQPLAFCSANILCCLAIYQLSYRCSLLCSTPCSMVFLSSVTVFSHPREASAAPLWYKVCNESRRPTKTDRSPLHLSFCP